MIEHELARTGGLKLLGSSLFSFSLIVVGSFIIWKIWKDNKEIQLAGATLEGSVKKEFTTLSAEQQSLSQQISQLRERLWELQKVTERTAPLRNTSVNQVGTQDPGKLAMLRKLVEENVQLRKSH